MTQPALPSSPLGNLETQYFLDEIWQKTPYLIKNAYPNFESLISAEELAGLACEDDVESRIVIESPADQKIDKAWQLLEGPFKESTLTTLPKSHWSLLVQAVDWWLPEAQALLEDFNFLPRWRRDDLMISYATKGGGVGPHYDHYDVFLLQASGQRRWEVGGDYNDQSPRVKSSPLLQVENWKAEQAWTLNPGDMLYVPPGVGHNGVALDDDCMTYSIGFRAPSHEEILCGVTDLISEKLSSDQRFTDAALSTQTNSGELDDHAIEQLSSFFRNIADDKNLLAQWLGKTVTAPKYPELVDELSTGEKYDIVSLFNQGAAMKHAPGTRMAFYQNKGECTLFVNEMTFTINEAQRTLAAKLANSLYSNLKRADTNQQNIQLLSTLLKINALEVAQ